MLKQLLSILKAGYNIFEKAATDGGLFFLGILLFVPGFIASIKLLLRRTLQPFKLYCATLFLQNYTVITEGNKKEIE